MDELFAIVESLCRRVRRDRRWRSRSDQRQRERIWKGRKAAFAAMGRVSPNYYVQDGVVPRTKLPEVLRRIRELEARSGLRIGNVFHAGDGNLHPLICYDEAIPGQAEHAEQVASEILTYCIEAGGSITGEHGVGADKKAYMPQMFAPDDLDAMQLVRCAFDPTGICNPGKVFPTPRLCGEVPGPYRQHPARARRPGRAFLMATATFSSRPTPPASPRRCSAPNGERLAGRSSAAPGPSSRGAPPAVEPTSMLSTRG